MKAFTTVCSLMLWAGILCAQIMPDLSERAHKGDPEAMNRLGFYFFHGTEGKVQNLDSALFWIEKAAAAGNVRAASNLGYMLSQDERVPHDYAKALKWLSFASSKGLPQAHAMLADMLKGGMGIAPDTLRAIPLYEKAIKAGVPDAGLKLLNMMGRKWHSLPSDSLMNLAKRHYAKGSGAIAADLLEEGSRRGLPEADLWLGEAYARGRGVGYSHSKSLYHYLKAALAGNETARRNIAETLEFFPDALSGAELQQLVKSRFSPDTVPADINLPSFWR